MSVFDSIEGGKKPRSDWLAIPDVINAMARESDPTISGVPWLDSRLRRGGLTPGRVYAFGGPPFTGKTTIVADIALGLSLRVPVYCLFSDEGRTQAAARMAVMLGLELSQIEEKPASAAMELYGKIGERSIYLGAPDSDATRAFDGLYEAGIAKGVPAAVILDSAQTIRPDADREERSERERLIRFMAVARKRAEEDGRIVILTSQSNRAWYRNRKAEDNSVAMSSFSGAAMEFGFDFAAVLSLPDDKNGIIRVEIVKNRLGHFRNSPSKNFAIRYDPDTGKMLEVDSAELETSTRAQTDERMAPLKGLILTHLRRSEGLTTANLAELCHRRKTDVVAAVESLMSEKRVFWKKEGRAILYFAVEGRV